MTIACPCSVCAALAGVVDIDPDEVEDIVSSLPDDVREVLAAQGRVISGGATARDEEVVKEAGRRCQADRFKRD